MPLTIDASTPAIAVQTNGATATVATAAFVPPNGSLVYARWSGNSTSLPATPTIAGGSLSYSLIDWQSRNDAPTVDGQAAHWWATGAGASMTVTVTNGASSGFRAAALRVVVFTGHDTVTPIGAHGKAGSASASAIAQGFTAEATGSQGFIGVCDWDVIGVESAGTGCTLEGSANVTTDITYGFARRTAADGVATATTTMNVTIPGTSTNLSWVYAEIRAAAGGGAGTPLPLLLKDRALMHRLAR